MHPHRRADQDAGGVAAHFDDGDVGAAAHRHGDVAQPERAQVALQLALLPRPRRRTGRSRSTHGRRPRRRGVASRCQSITCTNMKATTANSGNRDDRGGDPASIVSAEPLQHRGHRPELAYGACGDGTSMSLAPPLSLVHRTIAMAAGATRAKPVSTIVSATPGAVVRRRGTGRSGRRGRRRSSRIGSWLVLLSGAGSCTVSRSGCW